MMKEMDDDLIATLSDLRFEAELAHELDDDEGVSSARRNETVFCRLLREAGYTFDRIERTSYED